MVSQNSIEVLTANVGNLSICSSPKSPPEIDEALYSRQLYVLGEDAMRKMAESNVLIVGLGGVGVEVAKNIVLAGVRSVTLHDTKNTQISDLGSNFYLSSEHLGQNRAVKCRDQLARLNSNVIVETSYLPLTLDSLRKFKVVVLTEGFQSLEDVDKISGFCHENDIRFILCEGRGLFARVFCDFGDNFIINDPTGSPIMPVMLQSVIKGSERVTVSCTDSHGFLIGNTVKFWKEESKASGLGMTSQEGKVWKVAQLLDHKRFSIAATNDEDTKQILESQFAMKVNVPYSISFQPLMASLENPKFIVPDWTKGGNQSLKVHNLFRSMDIFASFNNGELPSKRNLEEMLQILKRVTKVGDPVDEKLAENFIRGCRASICPIDAIVGGWAGQEVMKACSGKFKPLNQWLFLDAAECIPEEVDFEGSEDTNSRYSGQISIFGSAFQEKLANLRYFVVGSGAIGCEILKNFAMMGIGTGPEGAVIVTDMDIIEKSNLNRQFLFRPENVGKSYKSTTAGKAIKIMNPDVNVDTRVRKVCKETESTFNSDFWNSLDGVANALDNVEARVYVNDKCVRYLKPLIESGTNGARGDTQIIIPKQTAFFKAPTGNPRKEIPMCTLKFFPSTIHHTIARARELFGQFFAAPVKLINQFLIDELKSVKKASLPDYCSQLEQIRDFLELAPKTFEDCVTWACCEFETLFRSEILDLTDMFPQDTLNDTGRPFWSEGKKFPTPVSIKDTSVSTDFVISAATLRANVFGISVPSMANFSLPTALETVQVHRLSKKINVESVLEQEKETVSADSTEFSFQAVETILQGLPELANLHGLNLQKLEFEKDDDLHMGFITAASNARAVNYGIPTATKLETKLIAGRIIPAIATTTSVVAGLVALEVLKLAGQCPLAAFKNCSIGLGAPTIDFFKPLKPLEYSCNGKDFNEWDRIDVKEGSLTVEGFISYFLNEFGWKLSAVFWKQYRVYSALDRPLEEELNSKIEEVLQQFGLNQSDVGPKTIELTITLQNSTSEENRCPPVYYCYE